LIFATFGTHEQPFDRALDLITPLAEAEEVLVQHGHTRPRPGMHGFRWREFLSYDEVLALMQESSSIVCHAGVGTIMTALGLAKTPVVIPRLRRFGEHVDDHQVEIASEFHRIGLIVACMEGDDLVSALEAAQRIHAGRASSNGDLRRAVGLAARGEPRPHA
jgi:UDP-N-acetylglucosamine transferase subunit ALG13